MLSSGGILEGCGPSWVPARALGECCGIRIRVRFSGSCFGECCRRISGSCGPGGRCGALSVSWKAAGLPGYQRGPWVSAAAPDPRPVLRQLLRGVLPKDLRRQLRATVAGVDPLRDLRVVNLVDLRQLRQLRPWGPLRGSECGRGSPAGLRLSWKAAGLPGYQRGPWVSAAGSGSASGSPAAASGSAAEGSPAAAAALGAAAGI